MAINNSTLTTSPTSLFTSSNFTGDAVTTIYFCNNSASTVSISVYAVKSGGVASNTVNMIYKNKLITAGDTFIVDTEKLIFNQGDAVFAKADTASAVIATTSTVSI